MSGRLIAWLLALGELGAELLIACVFAIGLLSALVAGELWIAIGADNNAPLPIIACSHSHCER